MFGPRCFSRPRPMCGPQMPLMPHPIAPPPLAPGPVIPVGGACHVSHGPGEVVIEPALLAAPNVFHHHKNVQHIQPVITQDVHHYHSHHKYVVKEEKKCDEVVKHAHGLCGPATTQPAKPCGCAKPVCTCMR